MKTIDLQTKLQAMGTAGIKTLAELSSLSERGLWKIRAGKTKTASEDTKERFHEAWKRLPRSLKGKAP